MRNILVAVLTGLVIGVVCAAEPAEPPAANETAAILAKLDLVLANQQQLLQRFDAVEKELAIIKIRASQKH